MCIKALEWARRQKTGSSTLKAVLRAIADYADEDGRAWPSQLRLASDTELTDRSVREALKTLEERGFLTRVSRRRPDNTRATDIIELPLNRELNQVVESDASISQPERPSGTLPELGSATPTGTSFRHPYRNVVPGVPERGSGLTTFEPPLNHQNIISGAASASAVAGEVVSGVSDVSWHVMIEKLIGLGVSRPAAKSYLGRTIRALGPKSSELAVAVDAVAANPWGDPLEAIAEHLKIEEPKRFIQRKGKALVGRKYTWPENYADSFWNKYPLKKDKLKAIRVLDYIFKQDKTDFEVIIDGVSRLIEAGIEAKFIPHPTTYLRNERWNDVYPEKIPARRDASRPSTGSLWAEDALKANDELRGTRDNSASDPNLGEWHRPSEPSNGRPNRSLSQPSGGDTGRFPTLRLIGGS